MILISRMHHCFKATAIAAYVLVSMMIIFLLLADYLNLQSHTSKLINQSFRKNDATDQSRIVIPNLYNDTYHRMLSEAGAFRSMNHQAKFLANKMQIKTKYEEKYRYQPVVRKYAAIKISERFAFLHIWKCGGTTVEEAAIQPQLPIDDVDIQARRWVALVRDPIDRFLSAWAECGVRLYEGQINFKGNEKYSSLNWLEEDYDFRIRAFLKEIQDYLPPHRSCHTHAFPQANFMLNNAGDIDNHIAFVGDLSEMRQNLKIAGLRLGKSVSVGRDAGENLVKKFYFQSDRNLLSDETLLELCEFYSMDYFLFDFDLPEVCLQSYR